MATALNKDVEKAHRRAIEKFPRMFRELAGSARCEMPDENGNPLCERAARIVILINEFPVAACQPCADYVNRSEKRK
jgi:hypothetical protein